MVSLAISGGERRTLQLILTHTLTAVRCYHPALLHGYIVSAVVVHAVAVVPAALLAVPAGLLGPPVS